MILKVPDRLSVVSIRPNTDAVVLSVNSVAILVHVRDVRDVPHSDAAFIAGGEDEILVLCCSSLFVKPGDSEEWPCVAPKREIGLQVSVAFLIFAFNSKKERLLKPPHLPMRKSLMKSWTLMTGLDS